jgi:bis(5'-nucleosidyl)-tetraphosphatase
MPVEKSAGAVIFRKEKDTIKYLLLHYELGHWDLAKGHIEKGEDEIATIKREVEEETGLKDIKFIRGFREAIKYYFRVEGKTILKFVTFYLAETKTKEIKISEEHQGFLWLSYKEALRQLTFKNAKDVLKKANDFLARP